MQVLKRRTEPCSNLTAEPRSLRGVHRRDANSTQESLHFLACTIQQLGTLTATVRMPHRPDGRVARIDLDAADTIRALTPDVALRPKARFEGDGCAEQQHFRGKSAEEEREFRVRELAIVVEAKGVGAEVELCRLLANAAAGLEEGENRAFLGAVGLALWADRDAFGEDEAVDELAEFGRKSEEKRLLLLMRWVCGWHASRHSAHPPGRIRVPFLSHVVSVLLMYFLSHQQSYRAAFTRPSFAT